MRSNTMTNFTKRLESKKMRNEILKMNQPHNLNAQNDRIRQMLTKGPLTEKDDISVREDPLLK
jgi:hypothetical protein